MPRFYPYQAAQSDQCSRTPLLHDLHLNWGYKSHNLYMPCFSICSLIHPFTCLLPVPLCSKATGAPLCFGTHASPTPKICHFHQSNVKAQFNSTSPGSTTTPQSCTAIMSFPGVLLLQSTPSSGVWGFFVPFFSLSVPLSCGKAQHMPQSRVCWRKTSVLIYYMNIWLSPCLPRLLKMVHFTVVTLHS